ncbi:AAA family ATPase [Streptomyces sp. CC210A]|uniref:AAA family ATPase n=1 Tax=Streptomyces sp. CC210A TaxID=2898184 RepID=UPI001F1B9AD2|nr:AAA family ATPase [Streptomyces sp. CC210A]
MRWLSLVPGVEGLPDPAAVRRELELARLLEPLERLVRVPFVGRERELAELRRYATGPQAAAPGRGPAPPLLVHGAGGMGKSTLLAHFVLDALAPAGVPRGDGGEGAAGPATPDEGAARHGEAGACAVRGGRDSRAGA